MKLSAPNLARHHLGHCIADDRGVTSIPERAAICKRAEAGEFDTDPRFLAEMRSAKYTVGCMAGGHHGDRAFVTEMPAEDMRED